MLMDARALPWAHERFLPVQRRTGCSWMLVDTRALPCTHERFRPVQRTGCAWMLVDDRVLSHGPMSDSYMCSAQDARGCSWMLVLSHGPMSDSYLCIAAHGARG